MSSAGAAVANSNWRDIERRIATGAIAVLPVAAAAKAHGLHLPMNTDYLQAEWLSQRLIEQTNVLVWPTLTYGYYPAFLEYPGSCSLPSQTFQELVRHIAEDIYRAGASRLVLLNVGISTMIPLQEAVETFPLGARPTLANVYRGARFCALAAQLAEQARGGHADEIETSIMLAVAPAQVDQSKAKPWADRQMQPGPLRRTDGDHPNYAPDGHYGDPTLATSEKGNALLRAMLDDLLALM